MELIRKTRKLGNSSGVILPKKLLGCEVKITLLKRPLNIRKITFKILENMLSDIQGIYLINENPPEVLAVSNSIKKIIRYKGLKLIIVPLTQLKKDILNPELKSKLEKSRVIINKPLLLSINNKEKFINNLSINSR